MKRLFLLLFFLVSSYLCTHLVAQKLITYESGMGTRETGNSDVWILYNQVRAEHEGMVLYADSAIMNIARNDFTAFRNVRIELSDTTTIYGDHLYYDGERRVLDIWDDTVVLVDGATVLRTAHIYYDRNTSTAAYTTWGKTVNGVKSLQSREGYYNSDTKDLRLYRKVVLDDSATHITTDTMLYNVDTRLAWFIGSTDIYIDSTYIYSEYGCYSADTDYAMSVKATRVLIDHKEIFSDTLYYWKLTQRAEAYHHVIVKDTINKLLAFGNHAEMDNTLHYTFVTDSAVVMMTEKTDTLYVHADTMRALTDSAGKLLSIVAFYKVKFYRHDGQGLCDSAYYSATDSLLRLFYSPVLWYETYQSTADSIDVYHDSVGLSLAYLNGNSMVVQYVDVENFNQLKGKNTTVFFINGKPTHADIVGNAEMVYYITEEDSLQNEMMVGVNVGTGSSMRIYFAHSKATRLVTYGNPDMQTYPLKQLPAQKKRLPSFAWYDDRRPHCLWDIFVW